MKNIILGCIVLTFLSGCGNVAHRTFVPQSSFDQAMGRKKDGEIGSIVCKDDDNSGLCSVVCRYKGQERSGACNKNERDLEYKLFFVEVDEQGRFYDDRQFLYLLDYLMEKNKQLNCKNGKKGLSIVTIVHGWRHNSKSDDTNVSDAEDVLAITHQAELNSSNASECKEREVVGIFVSWRGKSITSGTGFEYDPLEIMSFYGRKSTALNVSMGSVRELFSVLQQFVAHREQKIAEMNKCSEDVKCAIDRLIIVGHSFGGLIVFNALSEGLLNGITSGIFSVENNSSPVVKLKSDLIVLINPAIEAIKFEPIYQAVKRRGVLYANDANDANGFSKKQKPVFVAITAKNDRATRWAFPFARFFSTLLDDATPLSDMGFSFSKISSKGLVTVSQEEILDLVSKDNERYTKLSDEENKTKLQTMGHVERYWTHKLTLGPDPGKGPSCKPENSDKWKDEFERQSRESFINYFVSEPRIANYCSNVKLTYLSGDSKDMKHKEFLPYNSPVWVIHSEDKEILNGHSGYADKDGKLIYYFIQQLYHQLAF